jgi:hypothetical protein
LRLSIHMGNGPHIHSKHKKIDRYQYPPFSGWGHGSVFMTLPPSTATVIGPDMGSPLKPLVSAEHQIILSGNGWGSKLTWNDMLFHSRHKKGDWQHSYAFDGFSMDPSSCRYHHTCWPWLGRSDGVFGHCSAPKDMTVHCGWGHKPTWNGSHIHLKHERWLINFLCCGWGCWSVFMPWHQLLSAQRWEVHWNLWFLLNTKWYC